MQLSFRSVQDTQVKTARRCDQYLSIKMLTIPDSFLQADLETWVTNADYLRQRMFPRAMHRQRHCRLQSEALMQDYNAVLTKEERCRMMLTSGRGIVANIFALRGPMEGEGPPSRTLHGPLERGVLGEGPAHPTLKPVLRADTIRSPSCKISKLYPDSNRATLIQDLASQLSTIHCLNIEQCVP